MVVVGIGARANTGLFDGQLAMERGGIKVNGRMQTSEASVYAVGDVAAFPVALLGGDVRRFEHVDCARRTARRAVAAIFERAEEQGKKGVDYLPFFYSRVFGLSWQFYGDNVGETVHFGDFSVSSGAAGGRPKFGACWVSGGLVAGVFLEGGSREENEAVASAVRCHATIGDVAAELESRGIAFADQESRGIAFADQESRRRWTRRRNGFAAGGDKPTYAWHATVGVAAAVSIAAFAYWYGWQAPYVV
jgi:monodehydroascorbate reductase (NADH)